MRTLGIVGPILAFIAMTLVGLAAGWFARSQTMAASGPTEHAGEPEPEKVATELLTDRALKNMGVTCVPAAKTDYTVCREVLGIIEELPTSVRSVSARWGGTVTTVLPIEGEANTATQPAPIAGRILQPGETVMEILRAPIPMIERTMTGDVVQTVSETVHDSAVQLRASHRLLEISKQEFERVRDLNAKSPEGLPVIPRQMEINLQYEMVKAQTEVERLERRLFLHGFSEAEIQAAGKGTPLILTAAVWRRALERNGLWPATGEQILGKLPEELRAHPWTYAALGELAALGKCDQALTNAVAREPRLGIRFQEAAALLQNGHSLESVVEMVREGALDPLIRVRAPVGAPLWEVREIRAKPGERVEAGSVLAVLADSRRMVLELEAVGVDAALVEDALRDGTALEARPLVAGASPTLKGLRLTAYTACEGEREPKAYAVVENERLATPAVDGAPPTGTTHLRVGMRYRVLVPSQVHRGVFTFPRAALVNEGPEKLIFLQSGTGFRPQPVRVLYEDRESVVVADDGAVFAGDPVVVSGAFPLSLALRAEAPGGASSNAAHKHGPTCAH